MGRSSTGCGRSCRLARSSGVRRRRTTIWKRALAARTLPVIAVILVLGFLLLAGGAAGSAGRGARRPDQCAVDGGGVRCRTSGVPRWPRKWTPFGFEPQGFLDAWAPIFFFAMIFAIAMDYTVFLLATVREHWERTDDPRAAMVSRGGPLRTRHLRGRGRHGRRVLHLRHVGTIATQGDGRHPRHRGPARCRAGATGAAPGPAPIRWPSSGWASPAWLRRVLPDVRFSH